MLPNVPMLILYWREEDEFPSKLRVMFDPTADFGHKVMRVIYAGKVPTQV